MSKKQKRVWTDDQRRAAAERMAKMSSERWAKVKAVEDVNIGESPTMEKVRAPEVQAVLDTMTPERRAKLAQIQGKILSTPDGQRALARHEAEKAQVEGGTATVVAERPSVTEYLVRVSNDGTMVSLEGPCWCGEGKREWHPKH